MSFDFINKDMGTTGLSVYGDLELKNSEFNVTNEAKSNVSRYYINCYTS